MNLPDADNNRGSPRKNNKEIAAERREKNAERFKLYQDKANKKLHEIKSSRKLYSITLM